MTKSWGVRLKRFLIGEKREIEPGVLHRVSLIAFLAWVGLGADGLSSSAYGPEEAFKAVGEHTYLAIALAIATTFTVLIIAYSYSRIIEQFPVGGGGYVVASRLIGQRAGVISGSALVIDYVLTISISIAAGGDAIFSFLPQNWSSGLVLNAVLVNKFAGGFKVGTVEVGTGFVLITLIAEALLLFVAAQAGFIDGPRVMANMATDSYLPNRLCHSSALPQGARKPEASG